MGGIQAGSRHGGCDCQSDGTRRSAVQQRKASALPPAPPSPPPVAGDQERRAFEDRPKAPEKPETERTPKKKAKPTGRKPLPSHLEAEEHDLRPDSCSHCGGPALDVADELTEEK